MGMCEETNTKILAPKIMKVCPGIKMSSSKKEKKEEKDSDDDLDREMEVKLVSRFSLIIKHHQCLGHHHLPEPL